MNIISAPVGHTITGPADPAARMAQAAREFEAMAIKEMLRPMFETVDNSKGLFGGGAGEAAWQPMMVEQIAKQMSAHGGIGLQGAILAQMIRMQEARAADQASSMGPTP